MAIFVQINAMARQNDMGREGESEARAYLVRHQEDSEDCRRCGCLCPLF